MNKGNQELHAAKMRVRSSTRRHEELEHQLRKKTPEERRVAFNEFWLQMGKDLEQIRESKKK